MSSADENAQEHESYVVAGCREAPTGVEPKASAAQPVREVLQTSAVAPTSGYVAASLAVVRTVPGHRGLSLDVIRHSPLALAHDPSWARRPTGRQGSGPADPWVRDHWRHGWRADLRAPGGGPEQMRERQRHGRAIGGANQVEAAGIGGHHPGAVGRPPDGPAQVEQPDGWRGAWEVIRARTPYHPRSRRRPRPRRRRPPSAPHRPYGSSSAARRSFGRWHGLIRRGSRRTRSRRRSRARH
jgi:hypothetical protein